MIIWYLKLCANPRHFRMDKVDMKDKLIIVAKLLIQDMVTKVDIMYTELQKLVQMCACIAFNLIAVSWLVGGDLDIMNCIAYKQLIG